MKISSKNINVLTNSGIIVGIIETPIGVDIKATALIMHGLKSNKNREGYIDISKIAHKHGIQTVRFDFRGHGESVDSPNWEKYGVMDWVDDIGKVIKYLVNNKLLVGKTLLIPSSFSSDPSIIFSAKNDIVDRIIMVSPGLGKIPSNTKDNQYREVWWNKSIQTTQIKFEEYKKLLKMIAIPIHTIHSDSDDSVPIEQSKELESLIGDNFHLHVIKGGGHKYTQPQDGMLRRRKVLEKLFSVI